MSQIIHNKTLGISDLTAGERQLHEALRKEGPVAVAILKSDLYRIHRVNESAEAAEKECSQLVLRALQKAGCPAIEATPQGLRIAHGRLTKVKRGPLNRNSAYMKYCWLPEAYVQGIADQARKMITTMSPEEIVDYGRSF